jgi:phenylacetate-CoA ligase
MRDRLLADHYDALETRNPTERESALFARLPEILKQAAG